MKTNLLLVTFQIITLLYGKLASGSTQDSIKPFIPAVRVERNLNLTGKLDDPLWEKAFPADLNWEIMPAENKPARQKTTVRIVYNSDFIYIGFRCYDTAASNIRAHLTDRDRFFNDDYVIASIDTYNNYQRAYEFAVNPYGIQGDLLMMGSGNEDESYDLVWQSAASIDSEGWIAEMAIPFKTLSFTSSNIQDWTITLCRSVPRDSKYMLGWTKYDRNNPSWIGQGGFLKGLEGIKPGKSLDFLPYTMVERNGEKADMANAESPVELSRIKIRAGAGLTYSPGPNTTFNAVINPDFSQIESDAGQINVNTTFALYYPEKRPFFMSGMDLLQTPMYYSRTINNPLFAAKVNGKAGKVSYIAIASDDRNTAITVPGEEQSNTVETGKNSMAAVARLRYDMKNENFMGLLYLNRSFGDAGNNLGGIDWNLKFWKNWYLSGELFLSHTKELNDSTVFKSTKEFGSTGKDEGFNGESYYGTGMHLALMRAGRIYGFTLVQNNFSPTYQTYNGMYPEVNAKQSFMSHRYTFHINKKIIQRIRLNANSILVYNFDGIFKEFTVQPGIFISMIGQTSVNYSYMVFNRERFREVLFEGVNRSQFMMETTPLRGVNISFSGSAGKFIRRSTVPTLGKGYNLTTEASLEPATWLKTSLSWSAARLEDIETGLEFYNGHIFRNNTSLQFSRKTFLRVISEYNTFSNSINIYPLFNYKFNAFTMFCIGMTQDYLQYGIDESQMFKTTGYQYFAKIQYLFNR